MLYNYNNVRWITFKVVRLFLEFLLNSKHLLWHFFFINCYVNPNFEFVLAYMNVFYYKPFKKKCKHYIHEDSYLVLF